MCISCSRDTDTLVSTERRNKSSLQTIMQNFVRIRGHDNKNHTIKFPHDDDGTIMLDYKDLAGKTCMVCSKERRM